MNDDRAPPAEPPPLTQWRAERMRTGTTPVPIVQCNLHIIGQWSDRVRVTIGPRVINECGWVCLQLVEFLSGVCGVTPTARRTRPLRPAVSLV